MTWRATALFDLLPDHTAESWAAWLQDHPSVEIVSRDRGDIYAHGTTLGAPHARQVADRWHLHHNRVEAVQRVVERHHGQLRAIAKQYAGATVQSVASSTSSANGSTRQYKALTTEELRRGERDQHYRKRYEQAHTLRQQGLSINAVARLMGLNRRTVTTLLAAGSYPGIPSRGRTLRAVAGFETYLRQRWHAGMRNVKVLHDEISAQGYRGAYSSVWSFVRSMVAGAEVPTNAFASPTPTQSSAPSLRAATWWLFGKTDRLTAEQRTWLQQWLETCSQIDTTRRLALKFSDVLHSRSSGSLRQWLTDAEGSGIADMQRFAASLRTDYDAVEAGTTETWSNEHMAYCTS